MPLTDTAIRAAKPKENAIKLSDGGGLFLLIKPNGTKKYWRFAYRFAGKQKLLGFGVYPKVSLADARAQRDRQKTSRRQLRSRSPAQVRETGKVRNLSVGC